jgi:cysteinyl-tRNA synthetase
VFSQQQNRELGLLEDKMNTYDTSAEALRARIQKVADEISVQLQKTPAGEQFFFISDIVNAVENAVGDVVNIVQDGVNAAVNVTHDVVNAVENIGERAVNATEEAIHAVTVHTRQILEVANFAAATYKVTIEIADLVGAVIHQETAGGTAKGAAKASAAQLIQARRSIILEQRKSLVNAADTMRTELKSRIDAVTRRISTAGRSSAQ